MNAMIMEAEMELMYELNNRFPLTKANLARAIAEHPASQEQRSTLSP